MRRAGVVLFVSEGEVEIAKAFCIVKPVLRCREPCIVIQFANIARNSAKVRNAGVCLYSSEIDEFEQKRQDILAAFKTALKNDEFAVYLQPKICVSDDRIGGVEALSRWTFEGKVRWSPDEYIPVLEASGDIILLAGKGHELYQEINGIFYNFDEREIVKSALRDLGLI